MPKYFKKSDANYVVKAQQWFGKGHVPSWAYGKIQEYSTRFKMRVDKGTVLVGKPGDYIVLTPEGELDIIKGQAFDVMFQLVTPATDVANGT